jgi:ATP phosphoribosyltransferase
MKDKNLKIISVTIAIIFLLIVFVPFKLPKFNFNWDTVDEEDNIIARNEQVIDSLKQVIEANNAKQLEYDVALEHLNDSIVELNYIVKKRENTIITIKKQTNEILNRVAEFNSSNILEWGSERYKDSLNIK